MKSAYELALERLERDRGPLRKLSEKQKQRIAEIEKRYEAKIAERRLEFDSRISTVDPDQAEALRKEFAETIASIEAKCQSEKEAVWNES